MTETAGSAGQDRVTDSAATDCRCGHPESHHSEGGASCWTTADGKESWDDTDCRCDWYEPKGEVRNV